MKLTAISLLICCLAAGCMTGGVGNKAVNDAALAQLPEKPAITLKEKDQPVAVVLDKISGQTGIKVSAKNPWFAGFPISVSIKDATLSQAISVIMGNLPYGLVLTKDGGKVAAVVIHAPRPKPSSAAENRPDKGIPPVPVLPPADGSVQPVLVTPASK